MNIIPVGFIKGFAKFRLISIILNTLTGAVIRGVASIAFRCARSVKRFSQRAQRLRSERNVGLDKCRQTPSRF
jgi:hypothetical protein